MAVFRIELSDHEAHQIEELAKQSGLTPEELIRRGVSEWLSQPEKEFANVASYVLKKNAELYKRLS